MISFGWCRGIEDAELLGEHGFEYIECGLQLLHLENEALFRETLPAYLNSPLPVRAFNLFFPGDMRIVGPELDPERVRRYIHRGAEAMNRIGARIAVLGSGRSRHIPEGFEREGAEDQMLHVLSWIAEEFAGTGVTLAIEPLNKKETNLMNSVAEAVSFAKQINHPSVRVLADFYHMDEDGEPLDTITQHKEWLAHIHIADTGRLAPGTGQYPYAAFAQQLKDAGYNGMISAECTVHKPEEELPASLAFMKRVFA